jgi:hypothetical protein
MVELLGGLVIIGALMATQFDTDAQDHNTPSVKRHVSENTYNSNQLTAVHQEMQKLADDRVPVRDQIQKIQKGDSFVNQFTPLQYDNPSDPVSTNKVPEHFQGSNRMSIERDLCLQGNYSNCNNNMTYDVIPENQLTHNNMQPEFRPKKGYGNNIDNDKHVNDISQRKMDLHTGSLNNLEYRPRTERRPLFSPLVGLTNIYGAPVMTSEYASRYIPSRERRNEKPFQETKVTPGLNLGYNEIGNQGFHDMYRAFDKTVNQLRVPSHAKISYTTPVIQQQRGSRQPIIPVVPKRRPITFEEWGTKRMLPTFNPDFSAPSVYGNVDPINLASVNRGTSDRVVYGSSQYTYTLSTPESLQPLVKDSTKENFIQDGPHNTTMVESQKATGFKETFDVPMTQRMQETNHVGPTYHQNTNKFYVFDSLCAVPDPNMRSLHGTTDRAGVVGNSQYAKQLAFDANNAIPDPTMRNYHENTDRAGTVGNSQYARQLAFDANNAIPDPNMRTYHNTPDRAGVVGNGQYARQLAFDANNAIPDPNMRTHHNTPDRAGVVGNSQYARQLAFDANNAIPDPNMRTYHDAPDRAGVVGNSQYAKQLAFDANNAIPDPNMRNYHENMDRTGVVGNNQYARSIAFDANNAIPDPNMRTYHNVPDRAGIVGNSQYAKQLAFDAINAVPDPNMRNYHENTDRAGVVGNGQYTRRMAFDAANAVPDPNMRNYHENTDRAGVVGNNQYARQIAFDAANAIPDPTLRDIHGDTDRAGIVGNGQYAKRIAFDANNAVPDPTLRDIHGDMDRAGVVGNGQYAKRIAFDANNAVPDPTLRNIHEDTQYINPAGYHERQTGREDARNMYQNVEKEWIAQGRYPTTCNMNKIPTAEGTIVEMCDNIQIIRDHYPDITQQVMPKMATVYTRQPHTLPNDDCRYNSFAIDNLMTNKYINNSQHRSVD